ncbi:hydrolase, alpha/beta domain protein [Dictyocaulus viviparus]|uniref:Hydrolase, alpha/beta domain protein n=1 Tax=Dictyocaulus viviparus TaxID=29172 RepID=A0A0D8XLS4_DICVI|nr:hydrolase, alpha/beta domain protein [Dictyocaulus viviparus]
MYMLVLSGVIIVVTFLFWIYFKRTAEKPKVYGNSNGQLFRRVEKSITSLKKVYSPPWWCLFGDIQTIVSGTIRSCPSLPFVREVIEFSDGGALGIDWLHPDDCGDDAPIIFFLPGIIGSTRDCSYILHPAREACARKWRVVVYNSRGLGGVNLRNKIISNSVRHHDLAEVIGKISYKYPKAKIIGCGFSMGGMVLWNYLANCTAESAILSGALIVSAPFDPHLSAVSLEKFFPKHMYNRHITKKLVSFAEKYREHFENHGVMDFDHILKSVTIREFDTRFTVPLFGYDSVDHYYEHAALNKKVRKIPIPTLCLNADDDCFSPIEAIPTSEINESEFVVSVITHGGGHTAFLQNSSPNCSSLVDQILVEWASMLIDDIQE